MAHRDGIKNSPMTAWEFAECLVAAGLMTQEQVNCTNRIVIDIRTDQPVTIMTSTFGNRDGLKALVPMLHDLVPDHDPELPALSGPEQ